MRLLLFFLCSFSAFSQTCADIVNTYDSKTNTLSVPHNDKAMNVLLAYKPVVYPQRIFDKEVNYTYLTFIISRQGLVREKNQKGLLITFEDGTFINYPNVTYDYERTSADRYTAIVIITPQNAIDFTTKKIDRFKMSGKTGKLNSELANAVMVYTKCLLEY